MRYAWQKAANVDISMLEEIPLINEATDSTVNDKRDSTDDADSVTIVLAGKSGAGKSTLFQTILGLKVDISLSAKQGAAAEHYTLKNNNIVIDIIDTSCPTYHGYR